MSRTSFRLRLTRYYAGVLVAVLLAFGATVYAIIEISEAQEPPEVAAIEPPDHVERNLVLALAGALLVAVPLAVVGAATIARRGMSALDDVVETAARFGTERLGERVVLRDDAPTEVARLVESLNAMLDRLDRSVTGMRRFTADASHELRTPLAALMAELEITLRKPRDAEALRDVVGGTLESLQSMSRLVEALLVQAQADASALPLALRTLELGDVVRRATEPYEVVLDQRGISLVLELDDAVRATGDPMWVTRVITNLLDNAAKHTGAAGTVRVRVTHVDALPRVEVHDTGPGVSADEHERVFERFFRGEAARASGQGFGLGLSLSREIARASGGDLTLTSAGPGPCFVLTLPPAR